MSECACGAPAVANDRECSPCFRERIGSISHASASPAENRRWNDRLERYRATRAEGSQPQTTKTQAIDDARRISDFTGKPFRADKPWGFSDG